MKKRQQTYKPLRIIIAGGGTGGHVFPAIAIASALKKKAYNATILFVGAKDRLEMKQVPAAGFRIIGLDIAGLQRRFTWKNFLVPWKLLKSLSGAKQIIKRFKPDIVIGVGGYASGPVLYTAAKQKIPVVIQEQNSFPGITNRILGKKAGKICVAYDGMETYFKKEKIYVTGNPVRENLLDLKGLREKAMEHFGLSAGGPVLLVTGGSLGARSINEAVHYGLPDLLRNGIRLIWQTGQFYHEHIRETLPALPENQVCISTFIDKMHYAYAAADVVVSRAGAIAVSEICVAGVPAIFIPSPNVAEDHQTKNAMALVNQQAAMTLKDDEARERLPETVLELIFNEEKKQRMREKMAGLAYRNAADVIAGVALGMTTENDQ